MHNGQALGLADWLMKTDPHRHRGLEKFKADEGWFKGFMNRHPGLRALSPEASLEQKNAVHLEEKALTDFSAFVKKYYELYGIECPEQVLASDETQVLFSQLRMQHMCMDIFLSPCIRMCICID